MAVGTLVDSPARVLAKLLVDLGHVVDSTTVAWSVFVNDEPDKPDNAVTIYDTAGRLSSTGRVMSTGYRPGARGILVRVRSALPAAGWTRANRIAAALDEEVEWETVNVGGTLYTVCAVTRTTDLVSIGDESGTQRKLFTINAVMTLKAN